MIDSSLQALGTLLKEAKQPLLPGTGKRDPLRGIPADEIEREAGDDQIWLDFFLSIPQKEGISAP